MNPGNTEHIAKWAHDNNLKLNRSKAKEIVVHRPRAKNLLFPPAVDGVERLDVINVLGVLVDSTLSSMRRLIDSLGNVLRRPMPSEYWSTMDCVGLRSGT